MTDFAIEAGDGGVGLVVLCGSYAKGRATASSDLDLYFVPDDARTRDAVGRSFVLDGLPYDLWGPGWPFLEAIAEANAPNRPWAVSASLIADTKVLWHRSQEDLDRFERLRARIDELCQPEYRGFMIEKALAEAPRMLFQLEKTRQAEARADSLGTYSAGWKFVHCAVNALALVNQIYFHKGWGANHQEILSLRVRPSDLENLLAGIVQPDSNDGLLQTAKRLSGEVRAILLEAQRSTAETSTAAEVFQDVYPFVWEYRTKILKACNLGDPIAAAAAAVQLQEEFSSMMNKVVVGFYGARFNLPSEIAAGYEAAGLPDLIAPASAGDLPCLATRTKLLDSKIDAWLNAQDTPADVLTTMEELDAFLGQ